MECKLRAASHRDPAKLHQSMTHASDNADKRACLVEAKIELMMYVYLANPFPMPSLPLHLSFL